MEGGHTVNWLGMVLEAPTTKTLDFLRELWAYADRTYFQTMVNLIT